MEKSDFRGFRTAMIRLESLLGGPEKIRSSQDFVTFINGIKTIKEDKLKIISKLTLVPTERINNDLKLFFTPIFGTNEKQTEGIIKRATGDFFFIKKSFQLSHIKSLLKLNQSKKTELGDYFYLNLYHDYLETLTNRLKGLYQAFHSQEPNLKSKLSSSPQLYEELIKKYGFKVLENIEIKELLPSSKIETPLSDILITKEYLEIVDDREKALDPNEETKINPSEKENHIRRLNVLMEFMILFSTEFDRRFFSRIYEDQFNGFSEWKEYFEIYKQSWDTQQEIFGNQ